MQVQYFSNGGYVIHKMTIEGSKCTFSVWFDRFGEIVDSERFSEGGRNMGSATKNQLPKLHALGCGYNKS